ncbi:MAG: polymerase III, alpha subunit protein [Candidatus Uhrbacteria bacterium GW2011_GWE2_40_58]|nr:MAG: polymerase III, alpha subunit protein [Candidatus Uhrbacteria bacterium GW2011_GWF2_40_263]KKR68193.1 MAG: polymerase III, alpha subunit protein [Candidatus Uhrbacteria bacterium GW2011_GWE2_40_58]OGL97653.1 MAG: DNA polymerase III subunit alpha [Candidatus Uhrbacteria bacterium RIFOXYB2_FULL_41_18]HBK34643.1 DNA polymerase III subunit alpha [Candidatus Uhrbacteria bacterium]HCB55652.1 DNA polymerase III subunit alpha [Candidatus Uhrbacteria bacterium]
MSSPFVHLHVHSHYSLLEALPKVEEILAQAKEQGMDTIAITDNGALYGAIEFYQKAEKEGIKPLIGFDAYVAKEGRHLKRARIDTHPHRLVLLAQSYEGYLNLIKLSSIGFLEGFYYKPRIDKEVLQAHTKGLIALSGGYGGEIDELLRNENRAKAIEVIKEYVALFGEDNFYLELVDRPEIAEQETVNAQLIEISREIGVPLVATKNTFYLRPTDVEAWKILNCIKGGKTLEHFDRINQYDYDASLVSAEYMMDRFADVPEAIENTRKIADRCQVQLTLGEWNFPRYEIPEGKTFRDVMTELAYQGLEKKIPEITSVLRERMEYEINIIDQKGFCPYFLIVSDFMSWARANDIVVTTRGSAAGSLVGYAMNISTINPMTYKLPFERFLNPERPSAPDIDADFADNRRDEVLDYVRGRYGHEKVAQICTFGKMLARGSVRDVGRSLGFEYGSVDEIAKLVPLSSKNLKGALEESQELLKKYQTDANTRRIIDLARQIEGCARHVSIHAAGTVISPTALTDFTPLQIDTRVGKIITQYEMHAVESAGLVKMDFLGIRNLSILGDAIEIVEKVKGKKIIPEEIPVDDQKTFTLLSKGYTMGVFQLSGDGMTKYLVDLKPERVEDIMAMVALYRPGPMESIPEYIQRKEDPSKVTYLDPRMKNILSASNGVIVYQDDVMLIAIELAGYSWLEADKLRKAMGKKIAEEMVKQKAKLLEGFVEHGLSQKKAQELWKLIEPFAQYGFNKAHACSYGMIAYQTAYMKANYPAEYMTALMTAESGDLEKIAQAFKECERMGIEVLPPDINESLKNFTFVDDQTIRFGLLVIKNLGEEVVESIIQERKENGIFKDLADFSGRISHRAFNKKSLEALIKAGALDRFGERKKLLENMDRILMNNKSVQKEKVSNQQTLFALAPDMMMQQISLREALPATTKEILLWEKELLGLYVSAHPYQKVAERVSDLLTPLTHLESCKDGLFVKCGGLVTSVKKILTKKGDPMAFVGIDDIKGVGEIVVFPKVFDSHKEKLEEDVLVLVSAKVSKRPGEETKLLANDFIFIEEGEEQELKEMLQNGMWVAVPSKVSHAEVQKSQSLRNTSRIIITLKGKPSQELITELRELFTASPGLIKVCLAIESVGGVRNVETDYHVHIDNQFILALEGIIEKENILQE